MSARERSTRPKHGVRCVDDSWQGTALHSPAAPVDLIKTIARHGQLGRNIGTRSPHVLRWRAHSTSAGREASRRGQLRELRRLAATSARATSFAPPRERALPGWAARCDVRERHRLARGGRAPWRLKAPTRAPPCSGARRPFAHRRTTRRYVRSSCSGAPSAFATSPDIRDRYGALVMLRIGLVCPYSLSIPGGVQAQVLGLARELRRQGHEARVLGPCDGPPPASFVTPLGDSLPTAANGSIAPLAPDAAAALRTIRALNDEQFDVLHVHEPLTPGVDDHTHGPPRTIVGRSCAGRARASDVPPGSNASSNARPPGRGSRTLWIVQSISAESTTCVHARDDTSAGRRAVPAHAAGDLLHRRHEESKGLGILLAGCAPARVEDGSARGSRTARLRPPTDDTDRVGRLSEGDKMPSQGPSCSAPRRCTGSRSGGPRRSDGRRHTVVAAPSRLQQWRPTGSTRCCPPVPPRRWRRPDAGHRRRLASRLRGGRPGRRARRTKWRAVHRDNQQSRPRAGAGGRPDLHEGMCSHPRGDPVVLISVLITAKRDDPPPQQTRTPGRRSTSS